MTEQKYKVIAVLGKSASGKDTFKRILCEDKETYHAIVPTTTRDKRQNEKDGVHYFYIGKEIMAEKIIDGSMIEVVGFEVKPGISWFYGTSIEALDINKINVGIFNPEGLRCIKEDPRLEVFAIYLDSPGKTRLLRSLYREDNPDVNEIVRRYTSDEKDFFEIEEDVDLIIENTEKTNIKFIAKNFQKHLLNVAFVENL